MLVVCSTRSSSLPRCAASLLETEGDVVAIQFEKMSLLIMASPGRPWRHNTARLLILNQIAIAVVCRTFMSPAPPLPSPPLPLDDNLD